MWFLYNALFPVAFLLLLPRFLFRMARRGGYAKGFSQRFGLYSADVRRRLDGARPLWLHAVSVGELFVALRFIREYRLADPEARFVVTTVTSTGRALAARHADPRDTVVYFPLDFPPIMRRAFEAIRPRGVLLTECELWPNLLREAARRGVPIAVINARMSARSYRGYRKLRALFKAAMEPVHICAQSEADRRRFAELGAAPERLDVLGSMKYDVAEWDDRGLADARAVLAAAGLAPGDLVLLGGSTWKGEEAVLMDCYAALKPRFPSLRLVLVPRHIERTRGIERLIGVRSLRWVRRSKLDPRAPLPEPPDVLLVDTTGELRHLYGTASVVFVGKSLTARGGQNIIEAALAGRPIVVGPHMANFEAVMEDFRRADAVEQVESPAALVRAIERLLGDPALRDARGGRAAEVVHAKRGVLAATARVVLRMVGAGASGAARAADGRDEHPVLQGE